MLKNSGCFAVGIFFGKKSRKIWLFGKKVVTLQCRKTKKAVKKRLNGRVT